MEKRYFIPIDQNQVDLFFSPIRSKVDVVKLLMHTVKYVKSRVYVDRREGLSLTLVVDDMNRFIYESEDKIFSIRSPFSFRLEGREFLFYNKYIGDLDSAMTSKVLSCLNDDRFGSSSFFDFVGLLEENFFELDSIWSFIHDLMIFEDGYIRFDHDAENEDGRMHPLFHLDVCYTTASTFKIGTYHKPCVIYFEQLLNNKIGAKYLEKL